MIRPVIVLYLLCSLLLSACRPYLLPPARLAADYCGMSDYEVPPAPVVIEVWAPAPRQRCWRAYAPVIAANTLPDISVRPHAMDVSLSASFNAIIAAAGDPIQQLPDIAWVTSTNLPRLIKNDLITPFDDCRQRHTVFDTLRTDVWVVTEDANVWGMPTGEGSNLLYFSKPLLRKLGWDDAAVDALPDQIAQGKFTLPQLLTTAEQAVKKGIVQPGLGLIPFEDHLQNLPRLMYASYGGDVEKLAASDFVLGRAALLSTYTTLYDAQSRDISFDSNLDLNAWVNRMALNDAKAQGKALFWVGNTHLWRYLVQDHFEQSQAFDDSIGVALFPSASAEGTGINIVGAPHLYVILSEKATGRKLQTEACDVLAATLRSNSISLFHLEMADISVAKQPEYSAVIDPAASQFLHNLDYIRDYEVGQRRIKSERDRAIERILFRDNATLAESGALSPEEAVAQALRDLEALLGATVQINE